MPGALNGSPGDGVSRLRPSDSNSQHCAPEDKSEHRCGSGARLECARDVAGPRRRRRGVRRAAAACGAVPRHRPGRVACLALPLPHRVAHPRSPA
eukprot:10982848-Heterocapsa_arctica.AAC.1